MNNTEYYVIAHHGMSVNNQSDWYLHDNLYDNIGGAKTRSTQLRYAYNSVVISLDNNGYKDIHVKDNGKWVILYKRKYGEHLTLDKCFYLAKKHFNDVLISTIH